MTTALVVLALVGPPKAYLRALGQVARATTLSVDVYTTEMDGGKKTQTYRFRKPNRWRVEIDGSPVDVCDGRNRWQRTGSAIARTTAPKSFAVDFPIGFERFFDKRSPAYDTFLGPTDWKVSGKTRRAYQIRITEAGSYVGYIVVDAKTYLPIGHLYSEMGAPGPQIDEYRVVRIGGPIPTQTFTLP